MVLTMPTFRIDACSSALTCTARGRPAATARWERSVYMGTQAGEGHIGGPARSASWPRAVAGTALPLASFRFAAARLCRRGAPRYGGNGFGEGCIGWDLDAVAVVGDPERRPR